MKSIKRKGFTLVELLIVIVVIGILSAMMMLSSTEAVTSAKASNIVSNLRNLKTAALAYYTDHLDTFNVNNKIASLDGITPYLNGENIPDIASYAIGNGSGDRWYVGYTIPSSPAAEATRIIQKLAGRAGSVGLVTSKDGAKYTSGNSVSLLVR